jgi:hypothetical protein
VLFAKYNYNDQVKGGEMGEKEKKKVYRLLVGEPKGKRKLGRRRHRWVDNFKMELGEIG